jgi:hypothetical protein
MFSLNKTLHLSICEMIESLGPIGTRAGIHNSSFSSQLTNQTNKLECLILESHCGLMLCNNLAYWADS